MRPGMSPTSHTTNHDRSRTTYSDNSLGLQLDVSQLSIRARLARDRKDDHALVGIDPTRHVLQVNWKHVDRHETGVLTAAAVVAVGHGVVHVRVGNDLTSLRVHLCGIPVRLWVIEKAGVAMVC